MPADQRWMPSRVKEIAGTPSRPNQELQVPPAPPVVIPAPESELARPGRRRKTFMIERQDLREHGYTAGCGKCDAILQGREVGTAHSAACRSRFLEIFVSQGDGRVYRAQLRR